MAESWMTGKSVNQGDELFYDPATKKYYGYIRGQYRKRRNRFRGSKTYNIDDMIELDESELKAFKDFKGGKSNLGKYRGYRGTAAYKGPGRSMQTDRVDAEGSMSDFARRKKLMEMSERWDKELIGGERGSARMDSINRRKQVMSSMRDRYKRGGGWGSL